MQRKIITLSQLPIGSIGKIYTISSEKEVKSRLLDLGLITGTLIESLYQDFTQNLTAYSVRGTVIALRRETASTISITVEEGVK